MPFSFSVRSASPGRSRWLRCSAPSAASTARHRRSLAQVGGECSSEQAGVGSQPFHSRAYASPAPDSSPPEHPDLAEWVPHALWSWVERAPIISAKRPLCLMPYHSAPAAAVQPEGGQAALNSLKTALHRCLPVRPWQRGIAILQGGWMGGWLSAAAEASVLRAPSSLFAGAPLTGSTRSWNSQDEMPKSVLALCQSHLFCCCWVRCGSSTCGQRSAERRSTVAGIGWAQAAALAYFPTTLSVSLHTRLVQAGRQGEAPKGQREQRRTGAHGTPSGCRNEVEELGTDCSEVQEGVQRELESQTLATVVFRLSTFVSCRDSHSEV